MADPQSTNRPQGVRRTITDHIDAKLGLDRNLLVFGRISQGTTSPADERGRVVDVSGTGASPSLALISAVTNFAVTPLLSNQNPDGAYKPYNRLTWTGLNDVRLQSYLVIGSTATSSAVDTEVTAGVSEVIVDDATYFDESGFLYIVGGGNSQILPIGSIAGNTITLATGYIFRYTFAVGATVVPMEIRANLPATVSSFDDYAILGSTGYWYVIASYSVLNMIEAYSTIVTATSQRDWDAPALPTSFAADFTGKDCILTWDENSELDLKHYKLEIRNSEGGSLLQTHYGKQTKFTIPYESNVALTSSGANIYGDPSLHCMLYAVDFSGNMSSGAGLTATNAAPATPANAPVIQGFGRNVVFHADSNSEKDYLDTVFYIKYSGAGLTWDAGNATPDNHYMTIIPVEYVERELYCKYTHRDIFRQQSAYSPEAAGTPEKITYVSVNAETFNVDITDSLGTAAATLGGLFDNKKGYSGSGIGDLVNVTYGDVLGEDWIQYDFHFDYKFDVLAWFASAAHTAYVACSDDGATWNYYAGNASHALVSNTLTDYGSSEANAQTNYLTCTIGKTVAKIPEMVEKRYWRLYPGGSEVQFSEIRFDTVELATRFVGETINLSDSITIATADNTSAAVKMTSTGIKCFTADDDSLYYTEFNSTGLEAYINGALKTRIGRLAANKYGLWSIYAGFGGTGYADATVFADSGGITVKDGESGTAVGWIGKSGSDVGGWLKTLSIGGANFAGGLIKADSSGNVDISKSVTIGSSNFVTSDEGVINLLPNGGFEQVVALGASTAANGIPGFTAGRTGATGSYYLREKTTYNADVYGPSGQIALQVYSDTTSYWTFYSGYIAVGGSTTIQSSIYARVNSGAVAVPLAVIIYEYDRLKSSITNTTVISESLTATAPTRYSGSVTLNASTNYIRVYIQPAATDSSSNYTFLDCAQVEVGDTVTTYKEAQLSSSDVPVGMALNAGVGLEVYSSAATRTRVGNIGGLSDGVGGTVAANTMGIWNKGGFYFLDASGNAMFTASGLTASAYVSNTIAKTVLTTALQALTDGTAAAYSGSYHLAYVTAGTSAFTTSFPIQVSHSQTAHEPLILGMIQGKDTGTTPNTYSKWHVLPDTISYAETPGGLPIIGMTHIPLMASGAGIFVDAFYSYLDCVNLYAPQTRISSSNPNQLRLYKGDGTMGTSWDTFKIRYFVLREGVPIT